MKKRTRISLIAACVGFAAPAFGDSYVYQCEVELPVTRSISMHYTIAAQVDFDSDLQKLTTLGEALISVSKTEAGRDPEVFVLNQPLEEAASGDRYVMMRYYEAAYGLTARLSLAEGPSDPQLTIYHILKADEAVRVTESVSCEVLQ